ncbi:MAG: hypothetical protein EAZ95_13895 [Bacteroidetes bacterium]|nr:MAG: hypothetical protein EAZ95_13895 [Bacteroidota bacterium]
MRFLLAFTLFFGAHFCFAQADETKIFFSKDNFKIQYPQHWRLDTSKMMGTEFFVFSPSENESDKFVENVNLMIQDLSGQGIDLEKYKQITDTQIVGATPDYEVFESSIIKIKNKKCFKITYAMNQGELRLRMTSICFIKNEKAYLLTFGSEFNKYDAYKKIGEEILDSFSFTK